MSGWTWWYVTQAKQNMFVQERRQAALENRFRQWKIHFVLRNKGKLMAQSLEDIYGRVRQQDFWNSLVFVQKFVKFIEVIHNRECENNTKSVFWRWFRTAKELGREELMNSIANKFFSAKVFRVWKSQWTESNKYRAKVLDYVERNSSVNAYKLREECFACWKVWSLHKLRSRASITYYSNRLLEQVFIGLSANRIRQQKKREVEYTLQRGVLQVYLRKWRESYMDKLKDKAAQLHYNQCLSQRVVASWRKTSSQAITARDFMLDNILVKVDHCFTVWKHFILYRQRTRAVGEQILLKLLDNILMKVDHCFTAWKHFIVYRQRTRAVGEQILLKRQIRIRQGVFYEWISRLDSHTREIEASLFFEETSLAKCFQKWLNYTEKHKTMKQRVARIRGHMRIHPQYAVPLKRLRNFLLSKAMNSMKIFLEIRRERFELKERAAILRYTILARKSLYCLRKYMYHRQNVDFAEELSSYNRIKKHFRQWILRYNEEKRKEETEALELPETSSQLTTSVERPEDLISPSNKPSSTLTISTLSPEDNLESISEQEERAEDFRTRRLKQSTFGIFVSGVEERLSQRDIISSDVLKQALTARQQRKLQEDFGDVEETKSNNDEEEP